MENYQIILKDLKQNFGKINYFNDKRTKSGFRRIKIYGWVSAEDNQKMETLLKEKYSDIILKMGNTNSETNPKPHYRNFYKGLWFRVKL